LVDAETLRGYFVITLTEVRMSSFLAGLITGSLIGVIVTLLVLIIVAGSNGNRSIPPGRAPNARVFLAALVLLAVARFVTSLIWRRALFLHSYSPFC
jgi:hypothetical protein